LELSGVTGLGDIDYRVIYLDVRGSRRVAGRNEHVLLNENFLLNFFKFLNFPLSVERSPGPSAYIVVASLNKVVCIGGTLIDITMCSNSRPPVGATVLTSIIPRRLPQFIDLGKQINALNVAL